MIELTFTRELHASVIEPLATSGFPAMLRIGKEIALLFSDASIGEQEARIDERHRAALLSHPIGRVGAAYLALSHVMVTLTDVKATTAAISEMRYFDVRSGWQPMVAEGTPIVPPPTPEPEWLLARLRR